MHDASRQKTCKVPDEIAGFLDYYNETQGVPRSTVIGAAVILFGSLNWKSRQDAIRAFCSVKQGGPLPAAMQRDVSKLASADCRVEQLASSSGS